MATTMIDENPKVRVLDQVLNLLAVERQSPDLDEAQYALDLEREFTQRRDAVIEELQAQAA